MEALENAIPLGHRLSLNSLTCDFCLSTAEQLVSPRSAICEERLIRAQLTIGSVRYDTGGYE